MLGLVEKSFFSEGGPILCKNLLLWIQLGNTPKSLKVFRGCGQPGQKKNFFKFRIILQGGQEVRAYLNVQLINSQLNLTQLIIVIVIMLARSQRGSSLSHSTHTPFPQSSCSLTGSHACCHPEMTIWGMKGGPPPHFLWPNLIFFIIGKFLLGEK